jgi:hypothetical protein
VDRLYPVPSFLADELGRYVKIPKEEIETVVFVGVEANGSFGPVGTGFLVQTRHRGFDFTFMVTADHVLDLVRGDFVWIRLNNSSGEVAPPIRLAKNSKITNLPKEWDIAVLPIPELAAQYHARPYILDRNEHKAFLENVSNIELGDEVATIGLFTSHYGRTKNIPVVRHGHIAMLPDEPVWTRRSYLKAYIVEVRSILGLSGSPVFLNLPRMRTKDGGIQLIRGIGAILVGVMLGYFLIRSADDQIIVPKTQGGDVPEDGDDVSLDERNTGFALVCPIENLFDILELPAMRKSFDNAIEAHLKKAPFREAGVRPDGVAPPATDANPNHREDFTRLLGEAARKREQED